MLKKLLLFTCLASSLLANAQRETSNWYFGEGAGITFNLDGTVTALTDGKLNTFEGCTSISDAAGTLQFYTDGITVFNKNHEVMENGRGLYGDPSSAQSAIIVPKPEDSDILYIFTVDTSIGEGDPDRGFNYSTVKMSSNGGLGEVVEKNINLLNHSAEKITAVVKDCLDKSLWVITLSTLNGEIENFYDTYHAFEINPTGVLKTSVKSTFLDSSIEDFRGYLKVSSDGTKLASANLSSGLFLYDFDADTGILTNPQNLRIESPNKFPYGIEFSPNQQFLYVHASNDFDGNETTGHSSSLIQFDLQVPNINNSQTVIDTKNIYRGSLQLGENGKIYRTISINYTTGTPFLGVINNPDLKGDLADYEHNAVSLNGKIGTQGLPPFVQSFFEKTSLIKNDEGKDVSALNICEKEDLTLEAELFTNATYQWKKDGFILPNTGNSYSLNDLKENDSGVYRVDITFADPSICPIIGESFITVFPLPSEETFTLTQCDVLNPNDGIAMFNLNEAFYKSDNTYLLYETVLDRTNDNPIGPIEAYQNTQAFNQTVYYTAINKNGCENYGELLLIVNPSPLTESYDYVFYACDTDSTDELLESSFELSNIATTTYPNLDVAFYPSIEDVDLEKNEISGTYVGGSTTIFARLENNNQCLGVNVINLIVNPTPQFQFNKEYVWCTDGESPLVLDAPDGFDSYAWYKINGNEKTLLGTEQSIKLKEIGNFELEVAYEYVVGNQNQSCSGSRDFKVIPSTIAKINEIIVNDISNNNSVEILVSGNGDYEYSMDGINYQGSPKFSNVPAGFTTVYVNDKNACGVVTKLISVVGYPSFFTPNGDKQHDTWQLKGVNQDFQENTIVSIFDRYGSLLGQIRASENGWDGNLNGSPLPASDYWFKAVLDDGRIFNGHFALIR